MLRAELAALKVECEAMREAILVMQKSVLDLQHKTMPLTTIGDRFPGVTC